MQANIKEKIDAIIHDNAEHIKAFGGNVAEYLYADFTASDGQAWYLTDAEMEEYENDEAIAEHHNNEISDLIEAYRNRNLTLEEIEADTPAMIETLLIDGFTPKTEDSLGGWGEFCRTNFQYFDNLGSDFEKDKAYEICEAALNNLL